MVAEREGQSVEHLLNLFVHAAVPETEREGIMRECSHFRSNYKTL